MAVATPPYPVLVDLDASLEVARWRPLVHWLLALPHFLAIWFLQLANSVLTAISWFAILFTGRIPPGIFDFMALTHRYQWRVMTYALWMRESYPPFDFTASAIEPGGDPARFSIEYPERLSRGLIFVKWLLAVPHFLALFFVGIASFFVWVAAFFAVVFTGRWPAGARDFLVGVNRWTIRVQCYVYLLTDHYPPFSLD